MRRLGELWSSASDEVKEHYSNLSKQDKERQEQQLEEYKNESAGFHSINYHF